MEHIEKIRKQSRQRYAMEREQLESLLNAWGKKTFSLQEKIAEKSRLEGLGFSAEETKVLENFEIQQQMWRFNELSLGGKQADGMIMDLDHHTFKYVFFEKPH